MSGHDKIGDSYTPLVQIKDVEDFREEDEIPILGDRRDGRMYRYSESTKLAINVALATGRPLLIVGPSGCGKSSLAFNLARITERKYYEFVVKSESRTQDLLYSFDAVRRLGDCQLAAVSDSKAGNGGNERAFVPWRSQFPYIEPGQFWWVIDPIGARRRGYEHRSEEDGDLPFTAASDPAEWVPSNKPGAASLLLIDEIDKAEPDFPNNLLVPLGSWQFRVNELGRTVKLFDDSLLTDPQTHPLVVITSNQTRELPATFLRRCIVLEIPPPTPLELERIAIEVFGRLDELGVESLSHQGYQDLAKRVIEARDGQAVGVAEFLDVVRSIRALEAVNPSLGEIIKNNTWRSLSTSEGPL